MLDETLETAPTPAAFRATFDGRLRAIARTHDALARRRWAELPLAEVIELALTAVAEPGRAGLVLSGPPTRIPATLVLPLLLALNELATNAIKHGALSRPGGRLEVRWNPAAAGWIELGWLERDGPPARPSPRAGGGLELIENLVRGQLGGTLRLVFGEAGLEARLALPLGSANEGELVSLEAGSGAG